MFGGFAFAAVAFGQASAGGAAALVARATLAIATTAQLGLGPVLGASVTITVGTNTPALAYPVMAGAARIVWSTRARLTGPSGVFVIVNGQGGARVRFPSVTIHDVLGAQPNTADLTFDSEVACGAAVQIAYNSLAPADLLFSGMAQELSQQYESRPAIESWPANLIDHTFAANKKRPFGSYVNVSITTIAQDVITKFAPPGFTAAIDAGLDTASINFDGSEPLVSCLNQLATLCGGRVKVEYTRTIRLYIPPDASTPPPDPLDATHPPINDPPITFATDDLQSRTRVYGKGHGESEPTDVLANETILPIADAVMFTATGGQAIAALTPDAAQTLRIAYTGVALGGGGSLVGPGVGPATAPTVTPAPGTGLAVGAYSYAYTHVTAAGESLPSPLGGALTGLLPAPATAPTPGTPTSGAGPDIGTHSYACTFVTATGETLPGPTAAITVGVAAPPSALGPITQNVNVGNALWFVGDSLQWEITYVTAVGETTASPLSTAVVSVAWNGNPSIAAEVTISGIPVSASGAVTSKKLYRKVNGTYNRAGSGFYAGFVLTLTPGQTSVIDNASTGSQTGPPSTNTAGGNQVPLSAIPIGAAGVTQRKIYRTAAGAAQLKLVATIADNATTTYTDTTTDAGLGAPVPTTGTAIAQQVTVAAVALGPSSVTARKVYRTAVNGSQLKLLPTGTTFGNNTTTGPYLDANPDAALGANAPTGDASGLAQGSGQVLAGATAIPTAGAGPFAAGGGWAIAGQQWIRYTGISGNTLTGIPATGPGAITTTILYGSQLLPGPALVGVTGVTAALLKGSAVHIWVQRDDVAAQTALGQLERNPDGSATDGIREYLIVDERRGEASLPDLRDAGMARFARTIVAAAYNTFDRKTKAGLVVHINLPSYGPVGDFLIQNVTITIDPTPTGTPRYAVKASSSKFTFADLLQRVLFVSR